MTSRPRRPRKRRVSKRSITDEDLERLIRAKGVDENRSASDSAAARRDLLMYAVRLWSVRHARGLNAFYRGFEALLMRMHGLFRDARL